MALDAKHRSSIYGKLVPMIGEDDANALMSQYLEPEEAVTKDYLRAELAVTRTELREEIAVTRTELREEIAVTRTELREEIGELRGEMRGEFGAVRLEMAGLRVEMIDGFRRQQAWLIGMIAASTAVLGTLTSIF